MAGRSALVRDLAALFQNLIHDAFNRRSGIDYDTTLRDIFFRSMQAHSEFRKVEDGYLVLTEKGIRESFAQDLTPAEQSLLFAVQGATQGAILGTPVKNAAWHSKPSWFVIAANDRTIAPEQEISTAKRMGAKTLTVPRATWRCSRNLRRSPSS